VGGGKFAEFRCGQWFFGLVVDVLPFQIAQRRQKAQGKIFMFLGRHFAVYQFDRLLELERELLGACRLGGGFARTKAAKPDGPPQVAFHAMLAGIADINSKRLNPFDNFVNGFGDRKLGNFGFRGFFYNFHSFC
jgi:hypothetical protein